MIAPYAGKRFKVRVDAVDRRMKPRDKVKLIEKLDLTALEPLSIDLENAEVTFYLTHDGAQNKYFFGRLVAKTISSKTKQIFHLVYENVTRPYVAPTCLDHELAFILANMAQIGAYDFVYDPFVGSASTLISAAHFGALTLGSDIDKRVIEGTSVGRKNYNEELT